MQPDLATLAFVAQHTSNAVVITDPSGLTTWVNDGFIRITGYTLAEVVGRKPGALLQGPGTERAAADQIAAAIRAGQGFSAELLNYRKDGSSYWNAIECSAITDATGAINCFIAIQSDCTERRARDEALRRSAEALRMIVAVMPLTVFAADSEGRLTLAEGSGLAKLGLPPVGATGGPPPEDRPKAEILQLMRRALRGESLTANVVVDGLIFETRFATLRHPSGVIGGALGVALDVTEQMRATAELLRARDEAEEATRAKSAFLATMSHEIRTPLNAVIGMADLLLDTPMSEEQRRYAETVRTSGSMLLAVINDILDFSKIEAGNMELERQPFDLRATIGEVLELLAPRAEARGLRLAAEVDGAVPALLVGDPLRTRQILANLVGNAVKFTPQGEVLVRAHCRSNPAGGLELELAVSDTGIGIPPDRLAKLFHPFTQVDVSTTRRYGGTGLGLAISKRLCELMGGAISARSTPGAGSTFTALLPVATASAAPDTGLPSKAPVVQTPPLRILLAEDNGVNQQVALRMLKYLGYSADLAEDGLEVLRACATARYDVVLMDVQMPELDGLEATRRLRAALPPTSQPHIIAMTANAMAGDRELCLAAGMDDYLSKPVQRDELAAALGRAYTGGGQALDAAALRRMRADFGPGYRDDLAALAAAYGRQLHADIASMRLALAAGDRPALAALAHRLRGASLTIGAASAAALAHELEHGDLPPEAVRARIDALLEAGEQAALALELVVTRG